MGLVLWKFWCQLQMTWGIWTAAIEKCLLKQSSIWKEHFEMTAQTSILKVCLSNLDWKCWSFESLFVQMKIEDLLLVRLRRISFCHHCPGRREWKDSKTSRACRLLPRESDTGAIAKAPYRLLPRDSSFAWVCLSEAGNLNKRICVCPEKGRHNLLFVQNSRCRALF